jgi:hypothetical protein
MFGGPFGLMPEQINKCFSVMDQLIQSVSFYFHFIFTQDRDISHPEILL